jgi:RNA polymerase-associated protein CTR9
VLPLRQKVLGHNFNSKTWTVCYNFARILEELGSADAASELYLALLEKNPAYLEVYLRMSTLSLNAGKNDAALSWVCRALTVDDRNVDVLVFKAELHAKLQQYDQAEYICEDLFKIDHKDPRPALITANVHFQMLKNVKKSSTDKTFLKEIKHSRKFFHDVMRKDLSNVYAANGIGMICAEYHEFDAASEIFLRAKELNMPFSEDINNNLANTRLIQGRTLEAEQLFQLNMRSMAKSVHNSETGKFATMSEATSYAQFKQKRYEDAVHTLLRGIHHDPVSKSNMLRFWFNIASVRGGQASATMQTKVKKTVRAVQEAIREFELSRDLFTALSGQELPTDTNTSVYNPAQAKAMANAAEKWLSLCDEELRSAQQLEQTTKDERDRRAAAHQERVSKQEEEKAKLLVALAEAKKEKQRIALEKQKRLEELKAGWTAPPPESKTKDKKGKAGKRAHSDDEMQVSSSAGIQNGVYDSDSGDEGVSGGLLSGKRAEKDPFADDSDDDDEIFGSKRKADTLSGTGGDGDADSKKAKKSGVIADSESDDEAPKPAAPQVDADVEDLFNSDDD